MSPPDPFSSGRVRMFRLITEEMRGDRLAIDALVGVLAGNTLPQAIERVELVLANFPQRKDGRKHENMIWNDIVVRSREMLELTHYDLEKLAERQAAV